jgi:hypothetical protein
MLKRWCLVVAPMLILASLMMTPIAVTAESTKAFRQQNGLLTYDPPNWFLEGHFIAREKNPGYVFGPVKDFVSTLSGKTTWLIEDFELERLKRASKEGKNPEYSLFLEAALPEGTQYLVFVVLPHESAQAWFDARRAFHGRKAKGYYGETQRKLERALNQGLKIKAELRFLIKRGNTSPNVPEDVIMSRHKIKPVFDLGAGRRLESDAKTK